MCVVVLVVVVVVDDDDANDIRRAHYDRLGNVRLTRSSVSVSPFSGDCLFFSFSLFSFLVIVVIPTFSRFLLKIFSRNLRLFSLLLLRLLYFLFVMFPCFGDCCCCCGFLPVVGARPTKILHQNNRRCLLHCLLLLQPSLGYIYIQIQRYFFSLFPSTIVSGFMISAAVNYHQDFVCDHL